MKRWLSVSLSRRLLSSVTLFSPFDEGVKGRAVRIRMAGMVALVAATVVWMIGGATGAPTWCIARNGAGATALQAALDYACGSGLADCAPVQPSGICYLPNTLPSHVSYAFNSYYQRSNAAAGACDFGGTATVTVTDPSQCSLSLSSLLSPLSSLIPCYGSCTFPSSASTAGGSTITPNTNTPSNSPITTFTPPTTPTFGGTDGGVGGLSPPGFGSTEPNIDTSTASPLRPILSVATCLCFIPLLLP
ncbi:hypothetical protein BHE74_00010355 [Ensete ventricosum]|nr:hypothetical protein BHE74_00010355 [Ensete ventricosum]RZR90501.1 hypothetical protein BHM03_00018399 [Ensete ventricosum]